MKPHCIASALLKFCSKFALYVLNLIKKYIHSEIYLPFNNKNIWFCRLDSVVISLLLLALQQCSMIKYLLLQQQHSNITPTTTNFSVNN